MIFRLSTKLSRKIAEAKLEPAPIDPNRFADWSCHVFTCDRTQYVILTNTTTLYSVVMYGRGISSDNCLIKQACNSIREVMTADGFEMLYVKFILPALGSFCFAKALDRAVTGSMNDLIRLAKAHLEEEAISPFEASFKLNDAPMSLLEYDNPRAAMGKLKATEPICDN